MCAEKKTKLPHFDFKDFVTIFNPSNMKPFRIEVDQNGQNS